IHNGDNPTALEIDWGTGWASCFACGDAFSIRIGDPPQTGAYRHDSTRAQRPERLQDAPERAQSRKTRNTLTADPNALERLHSLVALWADAYATSPAAEYVRDRAIPDHIAQRLGWGYVSDNAYLSRHRLFIPYTDPAGKMTGGAGRALDTITTPKYKCLRNADGYAKTLVNGGAIAQARAARMPLVIVEGPFDAAACLAGGVPYVIALNGVAVRAEWLAGIPHVFLANDADPAGLEVVERFRRTVPVACSSFAADALEGCKDVANYWATHDSLPVALLEATHPDISPRPPTVTDHSGPTPPADLPDDLFAEAEYLGLMMSYDPAELAEFMADLQAHEYTLTTEERAAAWHAVRYAQYLADDGAAQSPA
ncbi:MAG: toprim domain-containing protein, partial [Thermomicrobiales bacterium]